MEHADVLGEVVQQGSNLLGWADRAISGWTRQWQRAHRPRVRRYYPTDRVSSNLPIQGEAKRSRSDTVSMAPRRKKKRKRTKSRLSRTTIRVVRRRRPVRATRRPAAPTAIRTVLRSPYPSSGYAQRYRVARQRAAARRIQRAYRSRRRRIFHVAAYRRGGRRARFTRARGFHLVPQTLKRTFTTTIKFLLPGVTANRPIVGPGQESLSPYAVVARQMFRVRPYILGPETGRDGEAGINHIIEIPYCDNTSGGTSGQEVTGNSERNYVWKQPAWDIHWTGAANDTEDDVNERQVSYRNPMFFAMLRFYNKFMVSGAETTVKWDTRPGAMPLHNWTGVQRSPPVYPQQDAATGKLDEGQITSMQNGAHSAAYADNPITYNTTGTATTGMRAMSLMHPQTCPSDPSLCVAINRRKERTLIHGENATDFGFVAEQKQEDEALMAENVRGLSKREKFPKKWMAGKEMPVFDSDDKIVQLARSKQKPTIVTKKYAPRDLHRMPKALPLSHDPEQRFLGQYGLGQIDTARTIEDTVDPSLVKYASNQCLQYHIRESACKDADTRTHSLSSLNPVMVTVKLKQHVFFYDRTKFSVDAHVSQGVGRDAPLKAALPIIRSGTVNIANMNLTKVPFAKDFTNDRMIVTSVS